jgi:hypothetical protein
MRQYVVQTTMLKNGAEAHIDRPFGEQNFGVGTVRIPKASYPLIRVTTERL